MAINVGNTGTDGHFFGGHHIWQSGINARLLIDPYDYQHYTGENTTIIRDASAEHNDLTILGSPRSRGNPDLSARVNGGDWYFNASNFDLCYITDSSQSDLDIGTSDFLIQFWMKTFDNQSMYPIMKAESATGTNGYVITYFSSYLRLYLNGSLMWLTPWSSQVTSGEWYNIAFQINRGEYVEGFIDGVETTSTGASITQAPSSGTTLNNTRSFILGGYNISTGTPASVGSSFEGAMGPIQIYKGSIPARGDHYAVKQNFNVYRGMFGK
tara:strand:+ start:715 stop:1521 length:807 start_codon:yes stop_codon:yes gene_type:complete